MRNLSPTLLAAQQQASAQPFILARLSDEYGGVSRLRFSRHYTGSEGDYYVAATGAGDGSLIRARIDPGTKVLYRQRIVDPGPGSNYTSWTAVGSVSASGAVALTASGANVHLFYVDTDTVTIRQRSSSDNGATFGVATTVAIAATAVTHLAAAANGTDLMLFWNVGPVLWRSRYTGGAWNTTVAWTHTVASITGLAAIFRLDWDLLVSGTESGSGDAKVWGGSYGEGLLQPLDTWSNLVEVTAAMAGTNLSFRGAALVMAEHWRAFFVEKYAGSVPYARLNWSTMHAIQELSEAGWRDQVAFEYESDYGVAAVVVGANVWLCGAAGVWSAPLSTYAPLDVSDDVIEAEVAQAELDGKARLVLRNDHGRYTANPIIAPGARLDLSPGYMTSEGSETSGGPTFWVDSVEFTTGADPRVILQAGDGWSLLSRWRSRRQYTWARTTSVASIIQFVCVRAGLLLSASNNSPVLTSLKPDFTIHPNEDGRTVFRRLLNMVPDVASMSLYICSVLGIEADDVAVYDYGDDGHTLVSGRYRVADAVANRARVFGAGLATEVLDFDAIASFGEARVQVIDQNLTSSDETSARASAELRAASIRARQDEITIFGVNCGQELYDVVNVTDQQAGLESAPRRILGLRWRFSRTGALKYDMTLRLGNP